MHALTAAAAATILVVSGGLMTVRGTPEIHRASGNAASGGIEPGSTGKCPGGGPDSPGQKVTGGWNDQIGLQPVDTIPSCTAPDFPYGITRDGNNHPDGPVEASPTPDPAPHPPVTCSYSDSSPVCSGAGRGTVSLVSSDPPYQGWGWFQGSRPEIAVGGGSAPASPSSVRLFRGRRDVLDFKLEAVS